MFIITVAMVTVNGTILIGALIMVGDTQVMGILLIGVIIMVGALIMAGGILFMEDIIVLLFMEGIIAHITTMVTAMGIISPTTEEEEIPITWLDEVVTGIDQIEMLLEGNHTPVQK